MNKERSAKETEYTNLKKELQAITSKIKETEVNLTEEKVQEMDLKLKYTLERNKILNKFNYDKEQLIKKVFNFLYYYDKKFSDITKSIDISNLRSSRTKIKEDKPASNYESIEYLLKKTEWEFLDSKNLFYF